jgi:hypothetical protein
MSLAIVICIGAAAAALWFWYPSGRDTLPATIETTSTEAGAGTTTSSGPQTTDQEPQLSVTYESPILGCAFKYPDSWVEFAPSVASSTGFSDPTPVIVGNPNTANAQGVPGEYLWFWGLRSHEKISPRAMAILEGMIADVMENEPSTVAVTLYEPVTEFQVNGMAARSWATRDPGALGPTVTRTVIITSGDGAYILEFCSPEIRLNANRPIFDAILDSFRPQQ